MKNYTDPPNQEGVFYSPKSNKFVVVMPNLSKSKSIRPFVSVVQLASEDLANKYYFNLKKEQ
jgi:hypothetical protein